MSFKQRLDFLGVGGQILIDGQEHGLHRGQPEGKASGKVFHQDTEEAFHGAVNHPVDHDGAVLVVVLALVGQVEALGQGHVQLDGAALPGPAQGILDVDVDFGTVEGAVALVDDVFLAVILQGLAQAVGGLFPLFIRADGFFRTGGKVPGERSGRSGCRSVLPDAAHPVPRRRSGPGVMKIWASSWWKARTRNKPESAPESSCR